MNKYNSPEEIPDDEIKQCFANINEVRFSARRFNLIANREIAFGDLGWWLSATRVFELLGITPQMLRPVCSPRSITKKAVTMEQVIRPFFTNFLEKLGILEKKYVAKNEYTIEEIELPAIIEKYDQLFAFPLCEKNFQELARILGKSINVFREDGSTGDHYFLFSVDPSHESACPAIA